MAIKLHDDIREENEQRMVDEKTKKDERTNLRDSLLYVSETRIDNLILLKSIMTMPAKRLSKLFPVAYSLQTARRTLHVTFR